MKILFVNRPIGMYRGGGETYALNIAKRLKMLGCEVEFIVSKPLFGKLKYPVEDFKTEYVASPYLRDLAQRLSGAQSLFNGISFMPIRKLFQIMCRVLYGIIFHFDDWKSQKDMFHYLKRRKKDYDIVQTFSLSVLASKVAKKLKMPVVIRFPGPPMKRDYKRVRICDAVIANGDAFSRIRNSASENIINIPPGIDSEVFKRVESDIRRRYNIGVNDKLLLFVGRFVPLKNLPFLIRAMAKVIESDSTIKLMLIGEGPLYKSIVKLVSELNIENNVIFTGRIKNDNLSAYYSVADIFVITSFYDNFPNVVLEAMACGLPVVGTKVGGIPQQIKNGVNGYLIENNNAKEFKDAVLRLVGNGELRREIGGRNRKMVEEEYDWEKSAGKFHKIYESILGKEDFHEIV